MGLLLGRLTTPLLSSTPLAMVNRLFCLPRRKIPPGPEIGGEMPSSSATAAMPVRLAADSGL
jgi:hypothetical protein